MTVDPELQLSVSLIGRGSGRVTSTPSGIDCPATCTATFPSGTKVSLAAVPDAGSAFSGWSGACSGPASCTVSETGTLSAGFAVAGGLTVVPVATQVPGIRLNPDPMRTFIRQWVKFEARLKGFAEPRVVWSVQEGDGGGTVAPDGTYTAPAQVGAYHVTATNLDDPGVRGSIAVEVVTTQDLYDYGGAILARSKVLLIWWGEVDEFQGAVDLFHRFLAGVNGSPWLSVLDQYLRGERAQVGVAGESFETPHQGAIADAGAQVCAVLATRRLQPDPGTIYALMLATSTGKFDHHATAVCQGVPVPIIVLSLPPSGAPRTGGCSGTITPAENMLWAFSHELAETITDPFPLTGWTDIFGQEIADDCASAACEVLATGSFSLNPLLSNSAHGCVP